MVSQGSLRGFELVYSLVLGFEVVYVQLQVDQEPLSQHVEVDEVFCLGVEAELLAGLPRVEDLLLEYRDPCVELVVDVDFVEVAVLRLV